MKVMQRLEAVISPSRPIGSLTCPTRTVPIDGNLFCPTQNSSSPAVLNWLFSKAGIEPVLAGFPECAFRQGANAAEVFAVLQIADAARGDAGSHVPARLPGLAPWSGLQGQRTGSTRRCPIASSRPGAW